MLAFVPISKSTLWRRIQARTFPRPVKLSERVTAWRAEEIRQWIELQQQGDPHARPDALGRTPTPAKGGVATR